MVDWFDFKTGRLSGSIMPRSGWNEHMGQILVAISIDFHFPDCNILKSATPPRHPDESTSSLTGRTSRLWMLPYRCSALAVGDFCFKARNTALPVYARV
jgi:hypothetical protein